LVDDFALVMKLADQFQAGIGALIAEFAADLPDGGG
jgi:hypothetical protein